MQKITPHLWFDTQAKEEADFYVGAFGNGSKVTHNSVIKDTPSGDCNVVTFDLCGYSVMGIGAVPAFKINPAISFMVNFDPSKDKQGGREEGKHCGIFVDTDSCRHATSEVKPDENGASPGESDPDED